MRRRLLIALAVLGALVGGAGVAAASADTDHPCKRDGASACESTTTTEATTTTIVVDDTTTTTTFVPPTNDEPLFPPDVAPPAAPVVAEPTFTG